ncbi:MAG TPA: trigger factor [Dehalococcoidales bacterium]|nr:trigger factor [Dehalococcoidales bacterium]
MKVTREKIENRQAYLTVEMEPAEMEESLEHSYRHLSSRTNIPGFRKGKAPRVVVERYLGKESLLEEAIKHIVPEAYEKALKEQEIEPFAQPEVEVTQSNPVIFKAVVPLAPTVELGDYHSIRIAPEPAEVTEENVESVLEELRHQHAAWEPVERPLDYNDLAVIDIRSEVGEKPYLKKLGAQYPVQKESAAPAPGFADRIVGMKKEEEREFKLTFPEDYPNKEVAGKEAAFKVKLSEIKEEKLPALDDALAGLVSPDFKTVAQLREGVLKSMQQRAGERSRMEFEEKVITAVIDQAQVAYPPLLVEMEINRILNEQVRQLQMTGRGMDDYLRSINKTAEQLRDEYRPVATKNVAASLVLGRVAEAEKIEVAGAEIDSGIDNMTRSATEDRREQLRKLLDNPQTRQSIQQSLMTRKTIERLAEIARDSQSPEKTTRKKTGKATKEEVK